MNCPKCDYAHAMQWLIGWSPTSDGHSHDPNQRTCMNCGWKWFINCPKCGVWRKADNNNCKEKNNPKHIVFNSATGEQCEECWEALRNTDFYIG